MAVVLGTAELETVAVSLEIMIGAIALIYMFANLAKRPEWEAYANVELYQVFFSAIILVMAIFVANSVDNVVVNTFHGKSQFEIAETYLDQVIVGLTVPTLMQMETFALASQWGSGIMAHFGAGTAWSYRFPVLSHLSLIESVLEFFMVVLSPFAASLMAQLHGLEIIKATMMVFVLPAGVILRTFPQTRDAGVFLIATAFGFYFVFPLTYVMHYNIMRCIDEKDKVIDFISADGNNRACGVVTPENWLADYNAQVEGGPLRDYHKRLWSSFIDLDTVIKMFSQMSLIIMQAIFLPGLSIMLTLTFIKSMTKFLSQKMG